MLRILGLIFLAGILTLTGCVSLEPSGSSVPANHPPGVYHKVKKGETLWRIAKAYHVDLDDIIRSNNIPNGARLEENQLLLIPKIQEPSDKTAGIENFREPAEAVKDDFGWPVNGRVVRYFGEPRSYFSRGIGIEASEGTPVLASRQGQVVFADYLSGYSYTVILDHQDGYFSVYCLNSKLMVSLGERIVKGQTVALAGKKGNNSFVYFEIRRRSQAQNPLYFLPKT